jgi:hypothetical protein
MKRANGTQRIDSLCNRRWKHVKERSSELFAFNILMAILWAWNNLQSLKIIRVMPGEFHGAALAVCLSDGKHRSESDIRRLNQDQFSRFNLPPGGRNGAKTVKTGHLCSMGNIHPAGETAGRWFLPQTSSL